MSSKVQLRRGTAAVWASANPTLAAGEPGLETDTGVFKLGDGSTPWISLLSSATKAITKRVTQPIAGDGGSGVQTSIGTSSGFGNIRQRYLVKLPVSTTRWRLRIRNFDTSTETPHTGQIDVTGVAVGTPGGLSGGLTEWDGSFSPAPAVALTAFSTPSDGSEYISGWVTDPTLQFGPAVKGISIGSNAANGIIMPYSSYGSRFGTGGTSAALFAAASAVNSTGTALMDIRIEYEFIDLFGSVPVVLAIGDSITRGLIEGGAGGVLHGMGGGIFQHQNWLGLAGQRQKFCSINLGIGGSTLADWAGALSQFKWARADLATTVPDAAVISLGSNDCSAATALATQQANYGTIVASMRTLGIPRIFLGTIIPRAFPVPTVFEVATLAITGAPTGGYVSLRFRILGTDYATSTTAGTRIAFNATPAQVAAQVQGVLPVGMTVVGSGSNLDVGTVTLTFGGTAYGPVSNYGLTVNGLTGGSSPSATFQSSVAGQTNSEVLRRTMNTWMRQGPYGVDGVFDFDKLLKMSTDETLNELDYVTFLQTHPNATGYQRMAQAVAIR